MSRAATATMTGAPAASARPPLAERWMALPRHYRWLSIFVVFFLAFQVWYYAISPMKAAWDEEAGKIEADLAEIARASSIVGQIDRKDALLANIGSIAPPAREDTVRQELNAIATGVAGSRRSVDQVDFRIASGQRLPRTLSDAILRDDRRYRGRGDVDPRLMVLTGELSFSSSPEDAVAIIRDLESREEIETISVVRLVKEDGRRLSVSLTLEAWAVQENRR